MTTQLQKQRSKTLDQLLTSLSPDFDKLQSKVKVVFEQGRKEGFNDMEIGDLVRSKMEAHYSDRTIRRVLPNSAKQQQDHINQKADKMSAPERELINIPDDKVTVTPTSKVLKSPEVKLVEGIRNEGPVAEELSELPKESETKTYPIGDEEAEGAELVDPPILQSHGEPEEEKTVFDYFIEINEGILAVWKALTREDIIPHAHQDLLLDHIKPTRKFRQDLIHKLDTVARNGIRREIGYLRTVFDDVERIMDDVEE